MQTQYSSRVIIYYKKNKQILFLIVQDLYEQWDFPIGLVTEHKPRPENIKQKLINDLGSKSLEFIPGFQEIKNITLTFEAELIHKRIIWYLVKSKYKKTHTSKKYIRYKWCSIKQAQKIIKVNYTKEILKKADQFLKIPRLI